MEQLKVCADKITILNGKNALCIVAQDEINDINNYCIPNKVCNEENAMKTNNITGYPSIDKPWIKYYDEKADQNMVFHTIYEKILENSKKYPQDVAIRYYGNKITYKQLIENADKCANALYSEGIREENCVTLCTSYVPEAIYIMIACSKIGAIANFINPLFKPDEMIARIKDTASKLFFIMDEMLDKNMETVIAKSGIKTAVIMPIAQSMKGTSKFIQSFKRCISRKKRIGTNDYEIKEWSIFLVEATDSAARVPYKENRGVIMVYSSGTTSASKGILLTEDGINATISSYNSSDFSYERGDTFYAVIPIWFSTGNVLSILMPLCKGITIIPELLFDKERVVKGIIKYKPTMTLAATSIWMTLIQSKHNNIDLSSLQYPITGGEKVTKVDEDNITKFLVSHKCSAPLLKGYGMCELGSTITTTTRNHNKPNSAGYPIKDVIVTAFDTDTNKELPYNERGEIRVNSPARMKEYFKNPVATNKFFFEDDNGQIWGCTGDIGYVDADGFVFIEGRASDSFFSENGKLIYLFDIEKVALQDVNVSQCKAINKEIHNRNIPVLHLALKSHMNIDTADFIRNIANKMEEELPKEAIPVYYKIWTALPVHSNGKRDVEKLREAETGLYDANGSCIDL